MGFNSAFKGLIWQVFNRIKIQRVAIKEA